MAVINQNNKSSDLENNLRLQEMDLRQLRDEATRLKVKIQETDDKTAIIDAIISGDTISQMEPGILIPLATTFPDNPQKSQRATELMRAGRNIVVQNDAAGRRLRILLQNREGGFYQNYVPGAPLTSDRLQELMEFIPALQDEKQEQAVEELENNPELFEQPLLVQVQRTARDGGKINYLMIYVIKKQQRALRSF